MQLVFVKNPVEKRSKRNGELGRFIFFPMCTRSHAENFGAKMVCHL